MKTSEFVKTVTYGGQVINVGLDDYGQSYFLEWIDEDGKAHIIGCGTYTTDYMYVIESLFGDPIQCVSYGLKDKCATFGAHGYCIRCPRVKE